MNELQKEVHEFNVARGWLDYHDPRSLTLAMTEELGELARHLAWSERSAASAEDLGLELADLLIYALSLANAIGVDAEEMVRRKLAINTDRFPT